MKDKTIIMGGTFDPVHNGHLIMARTVAEKCGMDRVILIPVGIPSHKNNAMASGADRLEMLKIAIYGNPLFEVSNIEILRNKPTYTYDTIMELKKDNIFILIGMDMVEILPKWYRINELLDMVNFVIVNREPYEKEVIKSKLINELGIYKTEKIFKNIVDTPSIEISSTDIRNRIKKNLSIKYLVPYEVEKYIYEKGLYK